MDNKKIVLKYFNKFFKAHYFRDDDQEFKALVRILNDKDKESEPIRFAKWLKSNNYEKHSSGTYYYKLSYPSQWPPEKTYFENELLKEFKKQF